MWILAISALGACNVTVLSSYFADGHTARHCFETPFRCETATSRLVATLDSRTAVAVGLVYGSSGAGNYAVSSARSGDMLPQFAPCAFSPARSDYACGGNLIKVSTMQPWDVQRVRLSAECPATESSAGSVVAVVAALSAAAALAALGGFAWWWWRRRRGSVRWLRRPRGVAIGESRRRPAERAPEPPAMTLTLRPAPPPEPAVPAAPLRRSPPAPRRSQSFEQPRAVAREATAVRRSQSVRTSRMRTRPRPEHRVGARASAPRA